MPSHDYFEPKSTFPNRAYEQLQKMRNKGKTGQKDPFSREKQRKFNFFEKKCENIWRYKKNVVPLHRV